MQNDNQGFPPTEPILEQDVQTLEAISKEKQERRFQRGLLWMAAGAITLVLSFAINFLCFQCEVDFHTPMYVLTSLGALGILKGMGNVFGL
jgi:hypothetical protein